MKTDKYLFFLQWGVLTGILNNQGLVCQFDINAAAFIIVPDGVAEQII
jgi:hypothetical protein